VPWIALGLLLGAGGVTLYPGVAGWILLGAAVLVFAISGLMARAQTERKLAAAKAAEAERARAELAPQLADAAERDRIAHERAEEVRVAAVEAILGGEGEAVRARVRRRVRAARSADRGLRGARDAGRRCGPDPGRSARRQRDPAAAQHLAQERPHLVPQPAAEGRARGRCARGRRALHRVRRRGVRRASVGGLGRGRRVPSWRRPGDRQDADLCYAAVDFEREAFAELNLDRLDPIATLRGSAARFSCSATFVLKPVADPDEDAEDRRRRRSRGRWSRRCARARPARARRSGPPPMGVRAGSRALEIPDGARLDRGLVERAVARLGDLYAEEKVRAPVARPRGDGEEQARA
jgi:hypothetical protein